MKKPDLKIPEVTAPQDVREMAAYYLKMCICNDLRDWNYIEQLYLNGVFSVQEIEKMAEWEPSKFFKETASTIQETHCSDWTVGAALIKRIDEDYNTRHISEPEYIILKEAAMNKFPGSFNRMANQANSDPLGIFSDSMLQQSMQRVGLSSKPKNKKRNAL